MADPAKGAAMRHLRGADGAWTVRDDVWVRYQRERGPLLAGPLGIGFAVYGDTHHFGPELQFGHVVGDRLENPVLLIKTAWGGKSLAKDFRPPSSGGEVGPYYTKMIAEVRAALASVKTDFPQLGGAPCELAGFVWYHGWNDGVDPKNAVPEYEQNLVNLIHDVRKEFAAPKLPVVVGELTGPWVEAPGAWKKLRDAQAAVAARPEFAGTVLFVPTHDFVRRPEDSPNTGHGHHEFGNAETYFLVGDALGKAMAQLSAPPPVPEQTLVMRTGRVIFSLNAGDARTVVLRGQWQKEPIALTRGGKGQWSVDVEKVPAGVWEYSFVVDGLNVIDPGNPAIKPQRKPGKSILHIPATPPAAWDWQDVPHGTVHTHSYLSKSLGKPREVVVYTPPGYELALEKKYPLLVLQHGSGDNEKAWVAHGKAHWIFDNLIAQGKAKPFVVMMIDGHPLGQFPREQAEARRAEGVAAFQRELFEDALPLVESLYRVEADRTQRAIAGLSMGGGQALNTGLAYPDRFAWIGAFSAGGLSKEAGEKLLADSAAINGALRLLWIAVGQGDAAKARNEQFIAVLKEKGVKHEWRLTEGDHSWPVWRRYLAEFAPLLFK